MNRRYTSPEENERQRYGREQLNRETGIEKNDEEFAAEVAAPDERTELRREANDADRQEERREAADNAWIGWGALVIAVISLFVWPAILGPIGVVAGVLAYWQGHRTLGVWSIAVGLISLAAYFILVPYYA